MSEELQYLTKHKVNQDFLTNDNLDAMLEKEVSRWATGADRGKLNMFGRMPYLEDDSMSPRTPLSSIMLPLPLRVLLVLRDNQSSVGFVVVFSLSRTHTHTHTHTLFPHRLHASPGSPVPVHV